MAKYEVMTASAKMPVNCWGDYGRVAVVERDPAHPDQPRMISDRARGIVRVVRTWERRNKGTTHRCAFNRARAAAEELAAEMNAGSSES